MSKLKKIKNRNIAKNPVSLDKIEELMFELSARDSERLIHLCIEQMTPDERMVYTKTFLTGKICRKLHENSGNFNIPFDVPRFIESLINREFIWYREYPGYHPDISKTGGWSSPEGYKERIGLTRDLKGPYALEHIIPFWYFDMTVEEDRLKCFHHTNLVPRSIHDIA